MITIFNKTVYIINGIHLVIIIQRKHNKTNNLVTMINIKI